MAVDGVDIVTTYNRWKSARFQFDTRWEEMARYIAPSRQGIVTDYTAGTSQSKGVYDSTSIMAAETFAMFLAGRIINPSDRWMLYQQADPTIRKVDAVREWHEECRDRTLSRLTSSMFYAEAPESLIDLSGFGTNCLLIDELPQKPNMTQDGFRGFHVRAKKTGRFVIAEGADGLIDSVMDESDVSARVCKERWGEARLPEKMKQAIKEGKPDKTFCVIHAILPRPTGQKGAGAMGMPWLSAWVEKESKTVMSESGYRRFPCAIARDRLTPGEVYGRGRGEIAFPDIWTLNMAKQMGLEDWALKIRPPVLMRHDSVIGTLSLIPAGPTSVNTHGAAIRDVIMPWETGSHPEVSHLKEEELRQSIREIFFVDTIRQLLQVNKSEMTAFEFKNKLDLLFRMVATIYGRLQREFLQQIVDIAWDLQFHEGDFPPPPPEVYQSDGRVEVNFENPIERAQRAGDADALGFAFQDLIPMAQILGPGIFDRLDPDKAVAGILDLRGVPASWTRNDEEFQAKRQGDAEAAAKQQNAAALEATTAAAGNVAPLVTAIKQPNMAQTAGNV